jgi:hypothetical protein
MKPTENCPMTGKSKAALKKRVFIKTGNKAKYVN